MDVTNGSRPANGTLCPGGLNTRILLVCNPTVAWPANRNLTDLIHSTYDDHCQVGAHTRAHRHIVYVRTHTSTHTHTHTVHVQDSVQWSVSQYISSSRLTFTSWMDLDWHVSHSLTHTRTHTHTHTHTHSHTHTHTHRFLLGVILYITVGMAYQYFAKGARGADIIPHYTFWSAVGSLVVVSC